MADAPGCTAFRSIHATVSGIFTFQGRIMQILPGILLPPPLFLGGPMKGQKESGHWK